MDTPHKNSSPVEEEPRAFKCPPYKRCAVAGLGRIRGSGSKWRPEPAGGSGMVELCVARKSDVAGSLQAEEREKWGGGSDRDSPAAY